MDKQDLRLIRGFRQQQSRCILLPPQLIKILVTQLQLFKERFGIKPEPGDPVFFNPDIDTPQEFKIELFEKEIATAMVKAGFDPALYYAFQKTGIFVTKDSWDKLPPEAQVEWKAAITEYAKQ
jgi:hypothetical protein